MSSHQKPPDDGPEGLRELLVQAALEILEDPDLPLDLRKVAEAAGKSRTAPYLVFGKESEGGGLLALRIAVAAEGARMQAERMEQAGWSTTDPLDAFRRVARAFLTFVLEQPRLFRLMYGPEIGVMSRLSAEGLRAHAEFGALMEHRMVAERALNRAIENCQAQGLLPPVPPIRYTMIAWATLIGIAFLLLDEVLEAAGVETDPEDAADLVLQSVIGLDPSTLEDVSGPFLMAQSKGTSFLAEPVVYFADSPAPATVHLHRRPPPPWEPIYRYSGLRRAVLSRTGLHGARVLWVDDHPTSVAAERATLEGLGVEVVNVRTTDEAEDELHERPPFDLVISDISRGENPEAGLEALPRYRRASPGTPVIYYVGRLDHDRGVPEGARGITNAMDELLHLVMDTLERRRP